MDEDITDDLPFSKRYGFATVDIPFQLNDLDKQIRTDLWNAFYLFIQEPMESAQYKHLINEFRLIYRKLWIHFFGHAYDDFLDYDSDLRKLVRRHIETAVWYQVYEFFEFLFKNINRQLYSFDKFIEWIEDVLEKNNSGYRLINFKFIPIINEIEIDEIKQVQIKSDEYGLTGIKSHLNSALDLISKKPKPDFRNSIKESISMVEVISRMIEPENTLGKALDKLEKNNKINSTLKIGLEKLYAYTNGKNGIRHALMKEENLTLEDAKFFLVSCSAFTNYLIEKANKENLLTK